MEVSPGLLTVSDFELVLKDFLSKSGNPEHRYASFDFCYNYFRTTPDVERDIEKSCLVLGFYLASWGMLRGSSFLLGKSAKHFEELVKYVGGLDRQVWSIDVDTYSVENIEMIISIYRDIRGLLVPAEKQDLVLTTKVLLGVFGFVPAFDNYFTATFRRLSEGQCGFRRVNRESLGLIKAFYEANKPAIDTLAGKTYTIDFRTGDSTQIRYPKAKIIHMYGFTAGLGNLAVPELP